MLKINPYEIVGVPRSGGIQVVEYLGYKKGQYIYKTKCRCGNVDKSTRTTLQRGKSRCDKCAKRGYYRKIKALQNAIKTNTEFVDSDLLITRAGE